MTDENKDQLLFTKQQMIDFVCYAAGTYTDKQRSQVELNLEKWLKLIDIKYVVVTVKAPEVKK